MPAKKKSVQIRDDRPRASSEEQDLPETVPASPDAPMTPCGQVQLEIDDLQNRVASLERVVESGPDRWRSGPGQNTAGSDEPAQFSPLITKVGGGGLTGGGTSGSAPKPALARAQGPDPIADTGYMQSSATVDQQGILYASTTTWSVMDLRGFTGGVFAVVGDASGAIIARSTIRQYGVDGLWVLGSVSSRTDNWTENFGETAAANGRTLGIVHIWDPKNSFFSDLAQVLQDAETIIGLIQSFCQTEPAICALISAAL
jgi:hypothetical protein